MDISKLIDKVRAHMDRAALKNAIDQGIVYPWSVRTFFADEERRRKGQSSLPASPYKQPCRIIAFGQHCIELLGFQLFDGTDIGLALELAMEIHDRTTAKLSRHTRISESAIKRIRKGKNEPRLTTLFRLANAFPRGVRFTYRPQWYRAYLIGPAAPAPVPPPTKGVKRSLDDAAIKAAILRRHIRHRIALPVLAEEYEFPVTLLKVWRDELLNGLDDYYREREARFRRLMTPKK